MPLVPLARRLVPPLTGPASCSESRYAAMRSWSIGIGPPDCGTSFVGWHIGKQMSSTELETTVKHHDDGPPARPFPRPSV